MYFVKNLREIRERKRVSQLMLAQKSGLNQTYISRIESGSRAPTLDTLKNIADSLGVHVVDLLKDEIDLDDLDVPRSTCFIKLSSACALGCSGHCAKGECIIVTALRKFISLDDLAVAPVENQIENLKEENE